MRGASEPHPAVSPRPRLLPAVPSRLPLLLLLLSWVAVPCAQATAALGPRRSDDLPVTARHGRIQLPATHAQERQECGYLLLPAEIALVGRTTGLLQRGGAWQSMDGATYASWVQELFRWSPDKLYYYRGAKMLFKAVLGTPHRNKQRLTLRDCEGVLMYTLVVQQLEGSQRYKYKIYDRERHFVASGKYGKSGSYPGQLFFEDAYGAPIAVAESPAIAYTPDPYGTKERRKPPEDAIPSWHLAFYGAVATNSTLIHAQNRWVIAAAVQDHAWRDIAQTAALADFHLGFKAVCALGCALAVLAIDAAVRHVYLAVYPPEREEEHNPFFRDAKAYGSLGPKIWEKKTMSVESPHSPRSHTSTTRV